MSETRQFPAAVAELGRLAVKAAQHERIEWRRMDRSMTWMDRADFYRDAARVIPIHLAGHKRAMHLAKAAERRAAAWCALAEGKGRRAATLRRDAGLWPERVPA